MHLTSNSFHDGAWIPGDCAFGLPDPATHVTFGGNHNPHLAWTDVPEGTRSFALICSDDDAPTKPDDVNQEGREVPFDLPRGEFFHWVMVDLSAECRRIDAGEFAAGVVEHGKDPGPGPHGARQGINDYSGWFEGDVGMEGDYYGYDGPCPPWNDARVHHYTFTLYALELDTVPLHGRFTGPEVRGAIEGHVLATASISGRYTLNPRLMD
ncbi:MAG TPA: YbhB/YbcL family Raf kinase inhibitor-like protein [Acidimicrobiia bacterium]|jgi:Raf kinase inhibitor-like YbhB/YbcL family protein|nr:YbhB/YbcL family Raf kinase inhibitor-like protein [Acidimicrobiia bacterium]